MAVKTTLLLEFIVRELREIEKRMAGQQAYIDGLVVKVKHLEAAQARTQTDVTALAAGIANQNSTIAAIQKQLADLQNANPGLDLAELSATIDQAVTDGDALATSADGVVAGLPPAPPTIP